MDGGIWAKALELNKASGKGGKGGKLEDWEKGKNGDIRGLHGFSKTQHRLGTVLQGSQTRQWKMIHYSIWV